MSEWQDSWESMGIDVAAEEWRLYELCVGVDIWDRGLSLSPPATMTRRVRVFDGYYAEVWECIDINIQQSEGRGRKPHKREREAGQETPLGVQASGVWGAVSSRLYTLKL
eukprot:7678896-Pyramimonas_sp.AAC.2